MIKKSNIFIGFLLLLPFILVFSILIANSAFLPNKEKEVIIEGKYSTSPYSLAIDVYDYVRKNTAKKVVSRPEEYFLNIRLKKNLYLIQTNKEIYDKVEKNNKIKVNIQETRLSHKIYVNNLGINPLSNEELANRQEEVRNMIKDQFKK